MLKNVRLLWALSMTPRIGQVVRRKGQIYNRLTTSDIIHIQFIYNITSFNMYPGRTISKTPCRKHGSHF